jgi:hypothetical protein
MVAKNPFGTTLIAPCGMDCAICSAFLREKKPCIGCNSPDRNFNRNCFLSACEKRMGRYCHDCEDYPCRRLRQLDKRYRTKYGMSMIENLETIKMNGIREFIKTERMRWTCNGCGGTIDVHLGRCSSCGKKKE